MGLFSSWFNSSTRQARSEQGASSAAVSDAPAAPSPEPQAASPEPTSTREARSGQAEPPPPITDMDTSALTAPAPSSNAQPTVGAADPALTAEFQPKVVEALKTVYDPEIPVDIYELGLIYDITVDADRRALVKMTLTSPACRSAQQIPSEVRFKVKAIPGIQDAAVEIVWEPPWDKDRMSEAAKLQLGFF